MIIGEAGVILKVQAAGNMIQMNLHVLLIAIVHGIMELEVDGVKEIGALRRNVSD